jgi:hypothetical protein
LLGGILGNFCMSLLTPIDEEQLNELAFFLTVGEQAPFKSASEINELTIKELKYWVDKLSSVYQKQKEDMEKSRRKK